MRFRSHPGHSPSPARRFTVIGAAVATVALALGGIVPANAAPGNSGNHGNSGNSSNSSNSSNSGNNGNGKAKGNTVQINLVTVNDFHGRIEQSGTAGGIARLSSAVQSFRDANPNTVFAAAGDMIGASTFTSFIQQDEPTIEALNLAGLDVSSVGNHEFDRGFDDLTNRVMPMADWEYLGANVYKKGTTKPALPEYFIEKFNGVRIGFVGAVTDELPSLVSPAGIADIDVGSPVEAANRVADQLSDGRANNGEADIVIMLVHEGAVDTSIASATDERTRFGKIVNHANSNIDAIVSGHTHLAYNHVIEGRPVISSGQYGERFSNMVITYNRNTKSVTSMENTIYTMAIRDEKGNVTGYSFEPDPALVPLVAEATALADVLGSVEVGETTGALGRATNADVFSENRGGESTLGNFVADVQKWALNADGTRDVQITFMNPGGLRADLDGGLVTYKEAAGVQPFANTLVSMTLTGAQIKAVLEEQWQPAGASRPFLKLGVNKEFTYTYDPTAATGSHITQMWLDGVVINPATTYSVGVNSFLASGGDNFTTLNSGLNKADSGKADLQAMVDWFAEFSTATPGPAQRAVGVHLPGGTSVAAGSSVTVNLSSLAFSRGELPAADDAVVLLDGAELGTGAVTTAYKPATDEMGTATVTFTVPAGATGPTTFDITVPSTGTTSSFTIDVMTP
ncbi:MAG TPA: bifunctional UDP-sugar hydrolase/5'-nucleotidase [Microbacterium sp.]|nr:bifunctional UDP-sugar hydrolase/5'-nucleotidase [Microbacterium sp.]